MTKGKEYRCKDKNKAIYNHCQYGPYFGTGDLGAVEPFNLKSRSYGNLIAYDIDIDKIDGKNLLTEEENG